MNKKNIGILICLICLSQTCVASALHLNASSIYKNNNQINTNFVQTANYVILTTNELEDAVKDFKTWKEYSGFSVEIVTIQWVSDNYNGVDLPEQIRNFLIDKYEEWQIKYLLIVGTRNIIPMRRCDPITWDYGEYFYCDYYYSDITGNWDLDQDGKYAEYSDDDVDFIPEISVGRIPSDDKDTVVQILENTMNFGSDAGAWKKNALLLGAITYYEGLEAYGWVYNRSDQATLMEECRIDIFDPEDFNCVRMYEAEGLRPSIYDYEYPLERSNVLSEWKNNYAIVNMVGHSNENLASRWIWDHDDGDNIPEIEEGELIYKNFLRISDSSALSMSKPPIVFSGGCSQLHGPNNMGRSFIEDSAAVAYIGTTDLGFYNITRVWNDESDGGFDSMDYYFFYYFISQDQTCGDALKNSKLYFYNNFWFNEYNPEWIYRCTSSLMAFTLYGDPGLSLIPASNYPPSAPTITGATNGKARTEYNYTFNSVDPDGDDVYFYVMWDDGYIEIWDGPYVSGTDAIIAHTYTSQGTYIIKAKAKDVNGAESDLGELTVTMPRIKSINLPFQWLQNFLQNHPNLFLLIKQLLVLN